MCKDRLTVGELMTFLQTCDPEMKVTFGASKYRKRPLVFYRFKMRGPKLLQIELSELDKASEPTSECEERITVSEILNTLVHYPDDTLIHFGSSIDAVPLEFSNLEKIVAINLIQTQEPKWVVGDD